MKKLNNLPIDDFKDEIINAVKENSVVIITAETGAGKSTRVPQFLLNEGYSLVVTQPRRLAVRSISKRVATEYGCEIGTTVGYRTAVEKKDSPETNCLFCTDGLAMVRELMGAKRHQILILDEVHEWNLNIEVLAAWSKTQIESGASFKLVIMSATLEVEKLSNYFNNAPVISVPGRCFPVEEKQASRNILDDVVSLLQQGRNVLVFQPGKSEIIEMIKDLSLIKELNAEILSLHGELEPEDQDKVFRHYDRPKCVVATNVAQTSITIDDIDAVVDGGTERRIELVDGVEGLYLRPISLADRKQRKGRAGRCREGIYIDYCPISNRLDYPLAEIFRVRLDQTVLRLAEAGIDAEELLFFHQPPVEKIHEAKRALRVLGCMDKDGNVTAIGRQVARLPISVQYGRMVIEADRLGVVGDVLNIAAILEQGGITARKVRDENGYEQDAKDIWTDAFCPNEKGSDIMAQLAVFNGAHDMSNDERRQKGIFVRAYHQVKERRGLLAEALRGKVNSFQSTGVRENILRAVCAGMVDHLYKDNYGDLVNGDGQNRQLAKESVCNSSEWLVGLPFDLEISTRRGRRILSLVVMATNVNPQWLIEVAPQLAVMKEDLNPEYSLDKDVCISTKQTFFNEILIKEEKVETPNHPDSQKVFIDWLVNESYYHYKHEEAGFIARNCKKIENLQMLNRRTSKEEMVKIYPESRDEWKAFISSRIGTSKCLKELEDGQLELTELDPMIEKKIMDDNPNTVVIDGVELEIDYKKFTNSARVNIDGISLEGKSGSVYSPGGRILGLTYGCGNMAFSTWEGLVDDMKNAKISLLKQEWLRNNRSADFSDIEGYKILISRLEPATIGEINGESVVLYPSIDVDYSGRYSIKYSDSDATEKNEKYLKNIFHKIIKSQPSARLESTWPWYSGYYESSAATAFNKKVEELSEKVNSFNFWEKIEEAKKMIPEIKKGIEELVSNFSSVESEVKKIDDSMYDEKKEINDLIDTARRILGDNFSQAQERYHQAQELLVKMPELIKAKEDEKLNLMRANNLPEYLVNAFSGDLKRALSFSDRVKNLPVEKLDEHIIANCGRAKVKTHLENIAGPNFFDGADPNDVKGYIYDVIWGFSSDYSGEEKKEVSSEELPESPLQTAMRRAGLIK